MKINKKELLAALKADFKAAKPLQEEALTDIERWRNEYDGKPYGNEKKGRSSLVSRDIKRQDEWQHASVKDPFVSQPDIIKCHPVTFEDKPAAEQNELILNYQFTRKFDRYTFMTDAIKLNYREGTVVVKTYWDYEEEVIEEEVNDVVIDPISGQEMVIGTKKIKRINVLRNQPGAEICRFEDIFLDPTSEGKVAKAQFIVHRFESDLSSLRKAKIYKNLAKLAKNKNAGEDPEYESEDDTEFKFQDDARRKIVVHEYWGYYDVDNTGIVKPIVCTWVDDVIIRLTSNPYPDQELPFVVLQNNKTPFKVHGEASVELISDNQKITTSIKRGIMDNMANSNNAQKGIRKNSLDPLNLKRFLNGDNFEYNGSMSDFYEGSYNQLPGSVFDVLSVVNNETESMLGVKSFHSGISGTQLGNTATAARGALDAVSVRRMDIVRNIAENLIKPIMRKWMAYNAEFLSEEEVVRITNDEFVPVRRDDLKGNIDIQITVATAEDNAAKAQELSFMLQTLGQQLDFGMLKLLMAQFFTLHKMPDLAKMMEEYQPQTDPLQEQMKLLEVEKMKAEILERQSRAQENAIDQRLKAAKAVLEETKADSLSSDIDLKDLDFLRKLQGADAKEDMMKKMLEATLAGNNEQSAQLPN